MSQAESTMNDLWNKLNYKGQNPVLIVDAPESFTVELINPSSCPLYRS